MPIYEYECANPFCKHVFDALKSIHSGKDAKCPRCGGLAVRIPSVPGKEVVK